MIYLLRHGEINTGGEKRYIGWTNPDLNENGVRQANEWRRALAKVTFEQIFSSDLKRSRQTARIIRNERIRPVQNEPRLREIYMGEMENLSMAVFRRRFPGKWRQRGENLPAYRPSGGESFIDLHHRVLPSFERISREAKGNVLVVSHAGVNRIILCHILGMPLANMFRIAQDYACLNVIDNRHKPCRVLAMNISPTDGRIHTRHSESK